MLCLISTVQQSDSVTRIYILFHYIVHHSIFCFSELGFQDGLFLFSTHALTQKDFIQSHGFKSSNMSGSRIDYLGPTCPLKLSLHQEVVLHLQYPQIHLLLSIFIAFHLAQVTINHSPGLSGPHFHFSPPSTIYSQG